MDDNVRILDQYSVEELLLLEEYLKDERWGKFLRALEMYEEALLKKLLLADDFHDAKGQFEAARRQGRYAGLKLIRSTPDIIRMEIEGRESKKGG